MSHRSDINSILRQVENWPAEDRQQLAAELLIFSRKSALPPPPRSTYQAALGIGRGPGPAPTDEEVREIIAQHRMEKYGT